MTNRTELKVWKLRLTPEVGVDTLEVALQEALSISVREGRDVPAAEIQRVDMGEQGTVVYFTAQEMVADTFAKTLRVQVPKAEAQYVPAKAEELLTLP